ncbi:hypothetical protein MGN01_43540 [Methylobacterium gnaphalii]|uniref:Uncharacterized protein n=1 Tax=Methylobacterium gnaphalii TaxID=1010610 RepID=A0A512JRD5_9HYPH|nr:hypothetical protein MGN01_43540 [Methylobacterium gnaphalii]GLS51470.1 hypothetical protein GCM10007885_43270 [Methylobacterium gnaphalii]
MRGLYASTLQGPVLAYVLQQLAVGSYDLIFDGETIGSVVQHKMPGGDLRAWWAELLDESPAGNRPAPFTATEHSFNKLGDVLTWLGEPEIIRTPRSRPPAGW